MEETKLMLFSKNDIPRLLELMEIKTRKRKGQTYLYDSSKREIATCSGCGTKIERSRLGNIMPGSKLLFCDNPTCFAAYIAEKKV